MRCSLDLTSCFANIITTNIVISRRQRWLLLQGAYFNAFCDVITFIKLVFVRARESQHTDCWRKSTTHLLLVGFCIQSQKQRNFAATKTNLALQSVQKKLTRGSLSAVENAIYEAWERLSSDATRSLAVKFPRYAETVVRAWVNRVWSAGVVQFQSFLRRFLKRFQRLGQFQNKVDDKNSECISKRFV